MQNSYIQTWRFNCTDPDLGKNKDPEYSTYELLRGTLGLRSKLAFSVKNPTPIPIPHSETDTHSVVTDSTPSLRVPCTDSDSLVASSVRFSVHGTRNERVESVTTELVSVSEFGMGIGVGFFTENASLLRNPRVPRNSSYADSAKSTVRIRKPNVWSKRTLHVTYLVLWKRRSGFVGSTELKNIEWLATQITGKIFNRNVQRTLLP